MKYCDYFDIDPEYFPQVNNKIIEQHPDLWKKFYPHKSFKTLLKTAINAIDRNYTQSIWVDGAYGTGKSHAVLTLKSLIEADEKDIEQYFEKYDLDKLLCKELISAKKDGTILVCHHYGSSGILSDSDLIVTIQEEIENSLKAYGIENKASASLRNGLIRYFEDEENCQSFDIYATGKYKDVLGGDKSKDVIEKLKSYEGDALHALIKKLFKLPSLKGGFSMDTKETCDWICEVIKENHLKQIFFIWDEFSEYFENNIHHTTGLQEIAELSETAPFCLTIVTHKSEAYFSEGDPDKKKILDRFSTPIHISLPENIAFELMGQAMKLTEDEDLNAKWHKKKKSLENRNMSSREMVKKSIKLDDNDLTNVLPIHPYAALVLQYISVHFNSNTRSMFNYIKDDKNGVDDDVQAFQWFIKNYDFSSPNPFVTIDMLWDFFYGKGKDRLSSSIRDILSCYTSKLEDELIEDEKRVLKTILLLQAISDNMSGKRDVFLPNDYNLNLAFEGSDLEVSASNIAKKLLNDHVVSRTPLTGDNFSYCCVKSNPTPLPLEQFIKEAEAKSTKDLSLLAADLRAVVQPTGALKLRYKLLYATATDFDGEIKKANNPATESNSIYSVVAIARDDSEAVVLKKKINQFFESNPDSDVVIIDATDSQLGDKEYDEFVQNYATALAIGQSDINQRRIHEGYAHEALKKWAKKIRTGSFYIYSKYDQNGQRVVNEDELNEKLMQITKLHYPECLEGFFTNVLNTMYDANSLGAGATCGITQELKGTYRSSNDMTKLEKALANEWQVENYWENSHTYMAELKKAVDKAIHNEFDKNERISIAAIYDILKNDPYGFMPCNITSFVLGFILKEYANGSYSYSDDLTTVPLDAEKLSNMIQEVIKLENTPNSKYKDKYIVTLSEKERAFNKATSDIFGIDEKYCVSITGTRSRIREEMKKYIFPIWLIENTIQDTKFKTGPELVTELIENFCGIANNSNIEGNKSDNDIALTIGQICIDNPDVVEDLKSVLTKSNCQAGMIEYLNVYRGKELPALAKNIGDGGQYINNLAEKFTTDAANWVWNKNTVNNIIDDLIVEYKIIDLSNKVLIKCSDFASTKNAWLNKIDLIKVSYQIIKNELGEEKELLEKLFELKKAGDLLDSQKAPFMEALNKHIDAFKFFMTNQYNIFADSCSFYLDEMTEDDIKSMLDDDKYCFAGSFTNSVSEYSQKVEKSVKEYLNGLGYNKLKAHWKQLTNTDSPLDWSDKYNMPILIMVPDDELTFARAAFETINHKTTDEAAIKQAEDYISKMNYVSLMDGKASRDEAFKKAFLSQYSSLFDDIEMTKKYIKGHVVDEPYYWLGNLNVTANINKMAMAKYQQSGCEKDKKVIDDMPAEEVKKYLKDLIENNITVGAEIIKNSQK